MEIYLQFSFTIANQNLNQTIKHDNFVSLIQWLIFDIRISYKCIKCIKCNTPTHNYKY